MIKLAARISLIFCLMGAAPTFAEPQKTGLEDIQPPQTLSASEAINALLEQNSPRCYSRVTAPQYRLTAKQLNMPITRPGDHIQIPNIYDKTWNNDDIIIAPLPKVMPAAQTQTLYPVLCNIDITSSLIGWVYDRLIYHHSEEVSRLEDMVAADQYFFEAITTFQISHNLTRAGLTYETLRSLRSSRED